MREREREILLFVRNKSFLVVALGGERVENTDENVKDFEILVSNSNEIVNGGVWKNVPLARS